MKIKIKANAAKIYWAKINRRGPQYCPANDEHKYGAMLEKIAGMEIEVETNFLFADQFNTVPIPEVSAQGMRIFDESVESVIDDIRPNVGKCGYCGNNSPGKIDGFCDKCLDSPYLKENELHLLRIKPCSLNWPERDELTESERAELLPKYIQRQTTGADSRNAAKLRNQRQAITDKYNSVTANAAIERNGMLWIIENGISVDNVIYYNHTQTFAFGWRSPLSPEVKKAIQEKMAGFPFNVEYK